MTSKVDYRLVRAKAVNYDTYIAFPIIANRTFHDNTICCYANYANVCSGYNNRQYELSMSIE